MSAIRLSQAQIEARLKQLPSLPSAVSEVLASFGNEHVDVDVIARQIARDQGLTARVLRVANSSFYGLQSKVGSINEAVMLLGFKSVRSIVLAVGMTGAFRVDQCPGFDSQAYLRHAVGTALAARALVQRTGGNAEYGFTAGLLHDIGQLVLAANFAQQYAEVLAYRRKNDCLLEVAERELLGVDHAEVGGMLAEAWRFPHYLAVAVREHHRPPVSDTESLSDVVHVADITSHALSLAGAGDDMVPFLDPGAWRRMALDAASYGRLLPEIAAAIDDACQVLSA